MSVAGHKRYLTDSTWPTTPWLGFDHDETSEYTVANFADYPLSRGWTSEEIVALLDQGEVDPCRDLLEILGLFQSWLFFGLLEDLVQRKVASSDFVVTVMTGSEDVEPFRDSSVLYKHLDSRCRHIAKYSLIDIGQEFIRISGVRWQANSVHQKLSKSSLEARLQPIERRTYHMIMLQLTLVDEATMFLRIVLGHYRESERISWTQGWLFLPKACPAESRALLEHRAFERGWCRSMIRELSLLGLDVLQYATTFGAANEIGRGTHSECTAVVCVAYNIDPSRYKPAHYLNCPCRENQYLQAPVESMYEILEQGEIPVVAVDWPFKLGSMEEYESFQIQYIPFAAGMRFAAFSHVWSDGLGSTPEDGFPICETLLLIDLAAQSLGQKSSSDAEASQLSKIYFWIDSLCIPKRSKSDSDTMSLRDRAIWLIRSTFENASVTVVLDRHLYERSGLDLSIESLEQQALRLVCCKWNHRVWTLHEGSVSRNIVMVTKNGAMIPIDNYMQDHVANPIIWKLSKVLQRSLQTTTAPLLDRLGSLDFRSTSRPEDAVLAMVPLLGMSIEPLLREEDYERRMEVFWLNIPTIPSSVIWQFGPKLTRKGFRWANKYLMKFHEDDALTPPSEEGDHNSLHHPRHADMMSARCTEQGLKTVLYFWDFGEIRHYYHDSPFPTFYEEQSSHLLWLPQRSTPDARDQSTNAGNTADLAGNGKFEEFNAMIFLTLPHPDRALTSHWWVHAGWVMAAPTKDMTQRIEMKMVANLQLHCKSSPKWDGASQIICPTVREALIT
jgi:hypothetical protein